MNSFLILSDTKYPIYAPNTLNIKSSTSVLPSAKRSCVISINRLNIIAAHKTPLRFLLEIIGKSIPNGINKTIFPTTFSMIRPIEVFETAIS